MSDLNTPSFTGALQQLIDTAVASAHIGMPARVESYDASQQRISAKPIIRRTATQEDGERIAESLPVIEGVPVIFPGAGAYKITWPIAKGDIVWLMFGECSLDKWLSLGGSDVDPNDDRRNALSDAVAIAGILPFSRASDQTDPSAMVLAGALKLGGTLAVDSAVKGTTYRAAEDALLGVIGSAFAALGTDTKLDPASKTACVAVAAALTAFLGSSASYLSTKVKTE